MHPQLARGPALVSIIFLKDGENEPLFEFSYCFRIKNIAFVHLQDKRFQLISHNLSLSF